MFFNKYYDYNWYKPIEITKSDHQHKSQEIEEKLEDGSLIINFEISHDEDIDNIIKSWLPHIEIIVLLLYHFPTE